MANTTNFGWETPDDTDLVKDGALAMRTLGNAIDTSLVDLKGGTTGQVLSKNTNTDMDFTWVTPNDADAIQNTIVDAKGDLVAASAADTPARLAVGNNGETLVADSSQTAGLRYNPPVGSLAQPVINGGFDVWQRGTSGFTTNNSYTADRWYMSNVTGTGRTVSRQTTSDTTNLPNVQFALRLQRDSGNTAATDIAVLQSLESVNSIPFAGKTITLSFYARVGANYSGGTSFISQVRSGTGTDQQMAAGFTGSNSFISNTATLTTTWTRYAYTGTMPAAGTQLGIYLGYTPSGTAGANDWVEVTGVQIDVGTWTASTAPTFRRSGGTLAGELAACQRYYYRIGGDLYSNFGQGYATSTTNFRFMVQAPVTMRVKPTALDSSAANTFNPIDAANTSYTPTSITFNSTESDARTQAYDAGGSGFTAARYAYNRAGNTTAAFIGFSAEL